MSRRGLMVVVALLMADVLSTFELTMVLTAMPTITRSFGSTDVVWLVTGASLMATMVCALAGRLGDLYGRSRVLLIVMALAMLGSTIAAFATNLPMLIAGTSIQGAGSAILPLALALIRERFPSERVPFFIGVMLAGSMLGGLAGLLGGGLLVDNFGWQSIYGVSAAYAAVAIAAVWTMVGLGGARATDQRRVAMFRGAMFAPAIAMLLFAITKLRDWGIQDLRLLGLVAASLVIGGFWIRHQLREEHPLINLRLLVSPQMGIPYLCIALMALGTLQHTMILQMFLQQPLVTGAGLGLTATLASYALMPVRVVCVITSPVGGRLVQAFGPRSMLIYAAAAAAVGWAVIAAFPTLLPAVLAGAVIEGVAGGMLYTAASSAIVQGAPSDRIGEAAGLGAVVRAAALAVGSQVLAQILATWPVEAPTGGAMPSGQAYATSFIYIAATLLVMMGIAYLLPRRHGKARTAERAEAAEMLEQPDGAVLKL
ncbi:MAG: MFS transporter [Phenylobacterium sp.]|uniref:MFS transporter n=1 Tax=Phenylobacterium sp. TaxID=1871053 RepID=UPI00273592D3|nr:MFS transporter [Phenylobacterium sp.]MDP3750024.1 MFS transporter [Phenylobacterium sp.]